MKGKLIMARKYKKGKRIRSISEYEISTKLNGQRMFWIQTGSTGYVRHIGWIESWQYRLLKVFIEHGYLFEAELKNVDDKRGD